MADSTHTAPPCLILAGIYPSRWAPRLGMFNQQQFAELARLGRVGLVSPQPWTRVLGARLRPPGGEPPPEPAFPVRRPLFWYAPRLARASQGRLMLASAWPAIKQMAARIRPRVLMANWLHPEGWAGVAAGTRLGLPVVVQILGTDANQQAQDPARLPAIRETLARAARVVTVSAELRERVIALGAPAERVVWLPNGVDTDRFQPGDKDAARQGLGLPADQPLVLFVGHLVAVKGPAIALEALARSQNPARLVMVGGGPLAGELKRRAQELGLADRVHWAGPQPHGAIADYLAACDALVLPSLAEGEPNAVLEALASGRPVAGSRVGGVPGLVAEGVAGHLAPPGDAGALAGALDQVLARSWAPADIRATLAGRTWRANAQGLADILTSVAEEA